MATIPATVPLGAVNFVDIARTSSERTLVLSQSTPGHPVTMKVTRKVLGQAVNRPYPILQVTIAVGHPVDLSAEFAGTWGIDNVSMSFQLPLASIATIKDRAQNIARMAIAYLLGGMDTTESSDLYALMIDNVVDSWTLGLI